MYKYEIRYITDVMTATMIALSKSVVIKDFIIVVLFSNSDIIVYTTVHQQKSVQYSFPFEK